MDRIQLLFFVSMHWSNDNSMFFAVLCKYRGPIAVYTSIQFFLCVIATMYKLRCMLSTTLYILPHKHTHTCIDLEVVDTEREREGVRTKTTGLFNLITEVYAVNNIYMNCTETMITDSAQCCCVTNHAAIDTNSSLFIDHIC